MKIEKIILENIRSHVRTLIGFSEGFNCLVGGVGTGKSSVLYAIDLALFGEPLGRSYEYLLREQVDVGRIVLEFVKNSKRYTIERVLRRQGDRISQDTEHLKLFEGEKLIAEMRSDAVAEQLRAITGIDRDIFREIIWVRQEHMKDILDMPPRERQAKLDQFFGLSEYEVSWTNLRPVLGSYEGENRTLERDPDVTGMQEIQIKHDEAVKTLAEKETELQKAEHDRLEAERRLEEASIRLKNLEAVRQKNEQLRAEINDLRLRTRNAEDRCARIAEEIERTQIRLGDLGKRLATLRSQGDDCRSRLKEVSLPSDVTVEQIQDHMESIVDQISTIQGKSENAKNEIKRATQRTSNLVKENKCPLCLQVLSPDYKEGLMRQLCQDSLDNKHLLGELEKNIGEFEHMRSVLSHIVSDLKTVQIRIDETERQIEEEKQHITRAEQEFDEKQKEERILRGKMAELRLSVPEFDLTEFEESQKKYKEALERHSNFKYRAQSLQSQKDDISLRLEDLRKRLDTAEKKAERLDRVKLIMELAQEIRQAYRSIQPKLRSEFVTYLERAIQQVMDELTGTQGSILNIRIDENYTPIVEGEGRYERSVLNLSGGERTFFAFAYRLAVGQLIMQWRVGHGLRMLLLDEPTESLGREDGSIDRLADALSRLKTVEQVIAVTHSEAFAEKADHVIRLEKRDDQSMVSVGK